MKARKLIKSISGMIGYYRFANKREYQGRPFNTQLFRQKIFRELMEQCNFSAIFETGTFLGTTTEYMYRESKLNVYSVESDPWRYGFCHARFMWNKHIKICLGDSRTFLRISFEKEEFHDNPVFIYLDAHSHGDLPLKKECEIILGSGVESVIMIDDFEVPGDPGYGFDDYGFGKRLSLEYLRSLDNYYYSIFFPNCMSDKETGHRRGCVVIATSERLTDILRDTETLVEFKKKAPTSEKLDA